VSAPPEAGRRRDEWYLRERATARPSRSYDAPSVTRNGLGGWWWILPQPRISANGRVVLLTDAEANQAQRRQDMARRDRAVLLFPRSDVRPDLPPVPVGDAIAIVCGPDPEPAGLRLDDVRPEVLGAPRGPVTSPLAPPAHRVGVAQTARVSRLLAALDLAGAGVDG